MIQLNRNKIGLLLAIMAISYAGYTQNLNQEIVTVGERELRVKEVFKQAFFPNEEDTVVSKKDVEYQIDPVYYNTKFTPEAIQAAKLRIVEPLQRLNRFYTRGGIGLYTSTLFDFHYNSLRNRKSSLSLAFNHRGSKGGIDELPNQGAFSDNNLALNLRFFNDKFRSKIYGNYGRIKRNLLQPMLRDSLGNGQIEINPLQDLEQVYNLVSSGFKLEKIQQNDKDFGFQMGGEFRYTSFYTSPEIGFNTEVFGSKKVNKETFSLGVKANYNQLETDADNQSLILAFNPSVLTQTENFNVLAGLSLQNWTNNGEGQFAFFPNIAIRAIKWEKYVVPYIELGGGYQQNSIHQILGVNPYLLEQLQLLATKDKLKLEVGARTSLTAKSKINLSLSHRRIENLQLFTLAQDSLFNESGQVYKTYYANANWLRFKTDFSYMLKDEFRLLFDFAYNQVDMADKDPKNFIPDFEAGLSLEYLIKKKIIVNLGATYLGQRSLEFEAISSDMVRTDVKRELDAAIDLSLMAGYRYNRKVSAFIKGQNLLNQNYFIFDGYPAQGILVSCGFTYSF